MRPEYEEFEVRRGKEHCLECFDKQLQIEKSCGKRSNAGKSDLIGLEFPQEKKLLSRSLFLFHLLRHIVEAMALLQLPKATIFQEMMRKVIFFISFHIHFLIDMCKYLLQSSKLPSRQVHRHTALLKPPHQVR
jgi:hypothetical protein